MDTKINKDVHLLVINPQNNFCMVAYQSKDKYERLYPALPLQGVTEVLTRLADFILKGKDVLAEITVILNMLDENDRLTDTGFLHKHTIEVARTYQQLMRYQQRSKLSWRYQIHQTLARSCGSWQIQSKNEVVHAIAPVNTLIDSYNINQKDTGYDYHACLGLDFENLAEAGLVVLAGIRGDYQIREIVRLLLQHIDAHKIILLEDCIAVKEQHSTLYQHFLDDAMHKGVRVLTAFEALVMIGELEATYEAKQRALCISKAKSGTFLDAVYTIYRYNKGKIPAGIHPPKIVPSEVFDDYDEESYLLAFMKAKQLDSSSMMVGSAFFNADDVSLSFEDATLAFKETNPGYSEENYKSAIELCIQSMQ